LTTGNWRNFPLVFAILSLFGCRRLHKEPFEKAPLVRGQVEVVRLSETATLAIERVRFWSEEMAQPRFFLVLLPKSSQPPAEAFILNHGWWDRPEDLLKHLKVDEVYSGMLARGEARPALIVIPDVRFANFYRENSRRFPFPNYLTLVPVEVAGVASKHYGIPLERERWGIGGFSFGGYLSLDVGRHYPGRFARVSIVSGFADSGWRFWPSTVPDQGPLDAHGRGRQTIVVPGPVPRLFLACGTNDGLFGQMTGLHQTLETLGVPHEWSTGPGAHTWAYWSSVLPSMLRFQLGTEAK
jgi:enterochelin esterase-like enzyme